MRDNPSSVPAGKPLRPGVAVVVLVAGLAAVLIAGGLWAAGSEPTDVVVTASANDSLVDAADVYLVSELGPESPLREATLRAHSRNATATAEGTTAQIEAVHVGSEAETTWVRVNDTQYRVRIRPQGS